MITLRKSTFCVICVLLQKVAVLKGSVYYRREDTDTPQAEDALFRIEDIAAKTLEYMTAMEAAPQLKASGLDGDHRILADFGGTVLAGAPSKHGVQFVTWN